jgi:hypothetical protein
MIAIFIKVISEPNVYANPLNWHLKRLAVKLNEKLKYLGHLE